jgi:hypothetical protein
MVSTSQYDSKKLALNVFAPLVLFDIGSVPSSDPLLTCLAFIMDDV